MIFAKKVIINVTSWIVTVVLIIIIVMIYTWWTGKVPNDKSNMINNLMTQTWKSLIMSSQDSNPIIMLLHSNYAVNYLDALRVVATDAEILQSTGMDMNILAQRANDQYNQALTAIAKQCPNIFPQDADYKKYIADIK
jgi:hypothetical protein